MSREKVARWRRDRELTNGISDKTAPWTTAGSRQFWDNPPADQPEGLDWWVQEVVKVTDGDTMTFALYRSLPRILMDGPHHITQTEYDIRRVRVAIIDTPEVNRKETAEAGRDARKAAFGWLQEGHDQRKLKVVTYRQDNLSRYLGTPYRLDLEESLPSWMLRNGFAVLWS